MKRLVLICNTCKTRVFVTRNEQIPCKCLCGGYLRYDKEEEYVDLDSTRGAIYPNGPKGRNARNE